MAIAIGEPRIAIVAVRAFENKLRQKISFAFPSADLMRWTASALA